MSGEDSLVGAFWLEGGLVREELLESEKVLRLYWVTCHASRFVLAALLADKGIVCSTCLACCRPWTSPWKVYAAV